MNYLKPAIAGIIFGAVAFFFTFFVLRIAAFILIISVLFRLFTRRRFRSGWSRVNNPFYADSIRNEDSTNYRHNFRNASGWGQRSHSSPIEIKIA